MNKLLIVEVVVNDVKVVDFQVVDDDDDDDGDAAVMGNVRDDVKRLFCWMLIMTMVIMLAAEVL